MSTTTIQMKLPVLPEGFEYTGEYRTPKYGEYFHEHNEVVHANWDRTGEYPIVRRVPKVVALKVTWEYRSAREGERWQFKDPAQYGLTGTVTGPTRISVWVLTSTPILDTD
jgi:hypothetical protein